MSTVTTAPDITIEQARPRLTGTLPRASASVGVLAAVATTVGAAALRAAGVPLAAHGNIPLGGFAQVTIIAATVGGVLLVVTKRHSAAPRRRFVQMTCGLTAISCAIPVAFADTAASKIALVGLHLVAAAIIVPALARQAH
jgi:hypothetical protein